MPPQTLVNVRTLWKSFLTLDLFHILRNCPCNSLDYRNHNGPRQTRNEVHYCTFYVQLSINVRSKTQNLQQKMISLICCLKYVTLETLLLGIQFTDWWCFARFLKRFFDRLLIRESSAPVKTIEIFAFYIIWRVKTLLSNIQTSFVKYWLLTVQENGLLSSILLGSNLELWIGRQTWRMK